MSPVKDLVGQRFGKLTVIRYAGVHVKPCGTSESKWVCRCDCGNEKTVLRTNLKCGDVKSCGCLSAEIKKNQTLPNNKALIRQVIRYYKNHAKTRNIIWNLTEEEAEKILFQPCFYCGTVNSNLIRNKHHPDGMKYNGIDRIDNTKGYLIDNVVSCCGTCNKAKLDSSFSDFIIWAHNVSEHTSSIYQNIQERKLNE